MKNEAIVASEDYGLLMGVDDYSDITLSAGAKKNLSNLIASTHTGLVSASPLICRGVGQCPFLSRCPIYQADGEEGQYPVGRQCIVEVNLINDRFMSYMDELNTQGKAATSLTYRSQISALVDLDLREFRINLILAGVGGYSDGSMLIEQTTNITEDGEEVKHLEDHPAWRILTKIRKDRMDLLDAMGLTIKRDAMIKAALKQKDVDNFLTQSIELLDRIAGLEQAVENE